MAGIAFPCLSSIARVYHILLATSMVSTGLVCCTAQANLEILLDLASHLNI